MPGLLDVKNLKPVPFVGKPIRREKYAQRHGLRFYHHAPKDRRNNLILRRNLQLAAFQNPLFQRSQIVMCREDFLYWLNAYGRTYDPRISERQDPIYGRLGTDLPFITWPYQDDAALKLIECIEEKKDCVVHKSRDMGASWLILMVCFWYWLFQRGKSFMLISRKQDYVDKNKPNDVDSMFGKLDYAFDRLPPWMKPSEYTRTLLYFGNEETGGVFDGETTTSDSGRASRKTAVIPDEFASVPDGFGIDAATADVADCRIFNSTPKGAGNAFHKKWKDSENPAENRIERITMLWPVHPVKFRGAYKFEDGELKFLDARYDYPADYPYVRDGELRSPWFDRQEKRFSHKTLMAQEVNGDFFGSAFQFFDSSLVQELIDETARPAVRTGRLAYRRDDCEPEQFVDMASAGKLEIWVPFDKHNGPDKNLTYVVGCDISQGTGATASVASVGCIETGEQIAEYADANMSPREFAEFVVAMCKWFAGRDEGAFLIWEGNGPGAAFGKKVWESGYRRFYYRKGGVRPSKDVLGQHERPSTIGGWYKQQDNAIDLFNQFAESLVSRKLIVRSKKALEECLLYEYGSGGKIYNSHEKTEIDPSGAGESHSDRTIACALMGKAMKELGGDETKKKGEIPENCFAYRRMMHRKRREEEALLENSELGEEWAA